VDLSEPIFLGMDLPMLVTVPLILVMFAFAVWYGATQCSLGIDAEEQARRMDESRRS
jgi:hypothetical protein